MRQFVHLRLHTEYSLVDGIVRVPELVAAVSAAGMPAVAVTDQSNLFAMVKFYKEALAAGVKPLIGVDAWIRGTDERGPSRIVFLCQNLAGYRHLTQLVTRSFLEGQRRGAPMLERSWLQSDMLQGLIVLSGAADGDIGQALARGRDDEALRCLARWQDLCGDRFYLEVQRTGRANEESYAAAVLELGQVRGVAALATHDVRFLTRAEFDAHEARVCIHDGALLADPSRARRYSEEQYLKSPSEMAELFNDAPELLDNTVEVAKRCSLEIRLGSSMLPAYPVPAGSSIEDFLRTEAQQGLSARLSAASASRRRSRAPPPNRPPRRAAPRRLPSSAGSGARRHLLHGIRRLFFDRGRFHPLGARQRGSRRARPRLRRRFAGRLRVGHYRFGSDRA